MSVSSPFIARPIATSLLGVAVLLGGVLGFSLFCTQPRQVTQKNSERIRIGMRYPDVKAILGGSGACLAAGKETAVGQNDEISLFDTQQCFVWREKGGWIAVGFDDKGWLTGKFHSCSDRPHMVDQTSMAVLGHRSTIQGVADSLASYAS